MAYVSFETVAARGSLDVAYQAIADPTRRRIIEVLAQGERSVKDLVPRFPISQPALSQHLRVLREAGLVRVRRHGRFRVYFPAGRPPRGGPGLAATRRPDAVRASPARVGSSGPSGRGKHEL